MKKTMKLFSMAALAMVGTIMSGCSNDEFNNENKQPVNSDNIVTQTMTVNLNGSNAMTRALDADGTKTFTVGDKIAIVYKNTSDTDVKVETDELDANHITNSGKTAVFTVTLTNPKPSGRVYYVYPASLLEGTTIWYKELIRKVDQDGTLASLASKYDYCQYDGTLTADGKLPDSPTLTNRYAIFKLTIQDPNGVDITSKVTNLAFTDVKSVDYVVKRSAAAGPIYVAVEPGNYDKFGFAVSTNDGHHYVKGVANTQTIEADALYPITVKMDKEITKGYLNKDGSITSTKQTSDSNPSYAYIAHVGPVANYCTSFIAIALEDGYTQTCTWTNAMKAYGTVSEFYENHKITFCNYTFGSSNVQDAYDKVTSNSATSSATRQENKRVIRGWRIPSITDWRYIFAGLNSGNPSATSPSGVVDEAEYATASTLLTAINSVCGNEALQATNYWTSSEGIFSTDVTGAWMFGFGGNEHAGKFWIYGKENNRRIRPVFVY